MAYSPSGSPQQRYAFKRIRDPEATMDLRVPKRRPCGRIDRICTHILAFEGDSNVYWFEGNFQDYEENRKKRLGRDIVPHRMKYRKLVRG